MEENQRILSIWNESESKNDTKTPTPQIQNPKMSREEINKLIDQTQKEMKQQKEADNEEFGESFGTGEAADKRRSELRFEKQRKEFNEKN